MVRVLRQPFQRVEAAKSYRCLAVAELVDRSGIQLGDALLDSDFAFVLQRQLGRPLPAGGQQSNGSTRARYDRRCSPDSVKPGPILDGSAAIEVKQRRDRHYSHGAH